MLDSMVLYGPGGASPLQVGSYLRGDQPWDFGTHDLLQPHYTQTPAVAGAALAFEQYGVRKMAFPLLLPSGGAGLSLTQLESLVRFNARPGAYIDFQPFGVASSEAVRFDLLDGRWEPDYDVHLGPIARRLGVLHLDTQPFGYWPTWITLASGVSSFNPLNISLSGVIGDAPAQARFSIRPNVSGNLQPPGSSLAYYDFVAWSLAGASGFTPIVSLQRFVAATYGGVNWTGTQMASGPGKSFNPTGANFVTQGLATFAAIFKIDRVAQPAAGRHRLFAAIAAPGSQLPVMVAADVAPQTTDLRTAMASAIAPVATVLPGIAPSGASYVAPSLMFQIIDLGEMTLPGLNLPTGNTDSAIRVWFSTGTSNLGATYTINFGGIAFLPLDGPAGVLPGGGITPSVNAWNDLLVNQPFDVLGDERVVKLAQDAAGNAAGSGALVADLAPYHRGGYPLLGATAAFLTALVGHRYALPVGSTGGGWPLASQAPLVSNGGDQIKYTLQYQPRFQFLKGL